jgi:hypothetical protein
LHLVFYKNQGLGLHDPITAIEILNKTEIIKELKVEEIPEHQYTFHYEIVPYDEKILEKIYSATGHGSSKSEAKSTAAN